MSRALVALLLVAAGLVLSACSESYDQIEQARGYVKGDEEAAYLFQQKCSGCHTLDLAGTEGSAFKVNDREYRDGPNFNERKETYEQVLYAIQNGGFSSGPMPQNIVTGCQAEELARFVAKYAGFKERRGVTPGTDVSGDVGKDVSGATTVQGCEE